MKCIAALLVLSTMCCALGVALPSATGSRSRLVAHQTRPAVRARWPAAKYAMRRSWSEEEGVLPAEEQAAAQLDAEDPATNEVIPTVDVAPAANDIPAVAAVDPTVVPAVAAAGEDDDDAAEDEPVFGAGFAKLPPHTFFPMNFGSMKGGSVAVANAFSTGKGSAFSHAVAHGAARGN